MLIPSLLRKAADVVPGGQVTGKLIDVALAELGLVEANSSMLLNRIDANVQALVEAPFKVGIIYLKDAIKAHRSLEEKWVFIDKAKEKFIEALVLEQDNLSKIQIKMYIGLCWLLLNQAEDSRDWLTDAARSIQSLMIEIEREFKILVRTQKTSLFPKIPVLGSTLELGLMTKLIMQINELRRQAVYLVKLRNSLKNFNNKTHLLTPNLLELSPSLEQWLERFADQRVDIVEILRV